MGLMEDYRWWTEHPELDMPLRKELKAIENDEKEIEDRFYTELTFGTAGLRGVLGAGPNRMNLPVVRRATKGLANYIKSTGEAHRGVAIAYDSRRMSEEFARETALVLAASGVPAFLFSTLHPVPLLSFAIRYLGCIAGVVITASHNPPEYNGYKVYWEHGGQITPEQAETVLAEINGVAWFSARPMEISRARENGLLTYIGKEVDDAYFAASESLLLYPDLLREQGGAIKIVYTPLYGTGREFVPALLNKAGICRVSVVARQERPDPNFPTVKAPNPEDPAAFALAFEQATDEDADLVLATDPDADRLGVAIRTAKGEYRVLTGNEIGCLLLHYILSVLAARGTLPDNGVAVKSVVSSRLADDICAAYGVELVNVLTGFRFISEIADRCRRTGEKSFIMGFEESYGFLVGDYSRDKDAVSSAMMVAEACVFYAARRKTLSDVLNDMRRKYGAHTELTKSYTRAGREGHEAIAGAMAALRADPPRVLAGRRVIGIDDYGIGESLSENGESRALPFPRSNMVIYNIAGGAWLCVRPSGTEPKLKLYVGAKGKTQAESDFAAAQLRESADELLGRFLD